MDRGIRDGVGPLTLVASRTETNDVRALGANANMGAKTSMAGTSPAIDEGEFDDGPLRARVRSRDQKCFSSISYFFSA